MNTNSSTWRKPQGCSGGKLNGEQLSGTLFAATLFRVSKKKNLRNFRFIFISGYQSLVKDHSHCSQILSWLLPLQLPGAAAGSATVHSSKVSCRLLWLQVSSPAVTCDPLEAQTASLMLLLETRRRLHRGHVLLSPNFDKRSKPSVCLCTRERENITICLDKSYLVNTFALLKLDSKCFVLFCFFWEMSHKSSLQTNLNSFLPLAHFKDEDFVLFSLP